MSFYILEILLVKDIIRRDYYIYTDPFKLKEKLYNYLTTGIGCYETVWYGAEMNIYLCRDFMPLYKIDMHAYVVFELDEYPQIYFDADNQPIVVKHDTSTLSRDDAEFDEYFCTRVCNGDENINAYIDISRVPPLEGRILEKQEIFTLPMFPHVKLHYGYNDLEYHSNLSDTESEVINYDYSSMDEVSFEDE